MARPADPAVRPALLEAAAAVLATDGLGALSVRRLAAEVGASTQAVYTHFDGKDDLVVAVVREAFARLAAELDGVGQTDDPLADLAAMGDAYRRNALANRHLYRVMFGLNPLALSDPAVELDPDALVELLGRACNLGFAVPEPAGWRLLPAVCRYLDHFESLALTAKTDGDETNAPTEEDWAADAPDDEENT